MLKDIVLTSHSPFIISDCRPESVLRFGRNRETRQVEVHHADEMGLNTYGSSITYILKNFFQTSLISNKSFSELKEVIERGDLKELKLAVDYFGESSEKQFLFRKLNERLEETDDYSIE